MSEYDHVVIGAGIVGSWTAYHLALLGKKVLLLEQFSQSHTRGSSSGESRIIRSSYGQSFFAEMMPYSYDMWRKAETESGKKLMETTGILCMFKTPEEEQAYQSCLKNMQTYSPEHLDLSETKSDLFNRVLNYSEKPHALLYDKSGGVLFAHKCVLTIQDLFIAKGGHLWHNCEVMDIVPEGNHIEINTSEQRLLVPSVIVCAGAWTKKLLVPNLMPDLPLKPILVKAYYWKEKEGGVHSSKAGFPVVIDIGGDADIYTIPSIEYPGLAKVCYHGGPMCDPDKRDQSASYVEYEQILKDHVTKHLPLLEAEPAIVETCMYTLTPDEVFLLDRVPGHKNIIIGSGFSGTGFKTSPAVARLLSEMATGQQTFLDLAPFRLSRFDDN